ncbi:VTT domain-containing protein [Candidatus Gottesmanbacteria bacterium]|nr:VTT domain-containing protein [Candidatus Gottesmanbacteria bacterium]
MHIDLSELIKTIGLLGVIGIIFAESGLLIGFFLPGDSLLFTAGFLASQNILAFYPLLIGTTLAAVIGDSTGYMFGHQVGKRLFRREDSLLFHKDHLLKAKKFYERHGGKTIILARFMPVIRTFAPIVAGMGEMRYSTFLSYNIIGGILWASGLATAGYVLGNIIPDVDRYLLPIVIFIIILSISPSLWHLFKTKDNRRKIRELINRALRSRIQAPID